MTNVRVLVLGVLAAVALVCATVIALDGGTIAAQTPVAAIGGAAIGALIAER